MSSHGKSQQERGLCQDHLQSLFTICMAFNFFLRRIRPTHDDDNAQLDSQLPVLRGAIVLSLPSVRVMTLPSRLFVCLFVCFYSFFFCFCFCFTCLNVERQVVSYWERWTVAHGFCCWPTSSNGESPSLFAYAAPSPWGILVTDIVQNQGTKLKW